MAEQSPTPINGQAAVEERYRLVDYWKLLEIEAAICRAHKRADYWRKDGGIVSAFGNLVMEVLKRVKVGPVTPLDLLNALKDKEGWVDVKRNQFQSFLNGQLATRGSKKSSEWAERTRVCLRFLLDRPPAPEDEKDKVERERCLWRIVEFFFPETKFEKILERDDWFFHPRLRGALNPMTDKEAESELRAMIFFAAKVGPEHCRILRVSGWREFWGRSAPGDDHEISRLTRDCLKRGIGTFFIYPQTLTQGNESPAQRSAEAFCQYANKPVDGKVGDPAQTCGAVAAKLIPLALNFGSDERETDGRPRVGFLTSFFRWVFYRCPRELDSAGKPLGEPIESLLVFREIAGGSSGRFPFSPDSLEIKIFKVWMESVVSQQPPAASVQL